MARGWGGRTEAPRIRHSPELVDWCRRDNRQGRTRTIGRSLPDRENPVMLGNSTGQPLRLEFVTQRLSPLGL